MKGPIPVEKPTRTAILDVAQYLVQSGGYNAFSYRDLSLEIGIKTSSIHYYFPAKSDLASALIARYRERFEIAIGEIAAASESPARQLGQILDLICTLFRSKQRVCLAGMLATDLASLPIAQQNQVREFFLWAESGLEEILSRGAQSGEFEFAGDAKNMAITLFASLQGAMLSAYALEDESRLIEAINWWRETLCSQN